MRNIFGVSLALVGASVAAGGQQSTQLTIHWEKTTLVSQTTPTLQVVVNPQLRHGEPLSIAAYKAVKDLGADYVRYVPWLPYRGWPLRSWRRRRRRRLRGSSAPSIP